MKQIPLTKGFVALVDDEDYEFLAQINWCWTKGGYALAVGNSAKFKRLFPNYEFKTRCVLMHRLLMRAPEDLEVDHENRNGLDNQRHNLRLATSSQNKHNSGSREGTSIYKGVCWNPKPAMWSAQIKLEWKKRSLGYYHTEVEAALAYDRAATDLHGEFASVNFPYDIQRYQKFKLPSNRATPASGYAGVSKDDRKQKRKFSAKVAEISLGTFETAYDAAFYRDFYIEKRNLTARTNF